MCKRPLQNRSFAQSLHFRDFKILTYAYIRSGFEITQALILDKIPGFAKPSVNLSTSFKK